MNTSSELSMSPPGMVLDPVLSTSLQLLTVVMRGDGSLEHALDHEMRGEWDDIDKREIYTVCNGVFRWLAKLDWVLNGFYHGEYLKCLPQMKNALRIALFHILYMPEEPAELSIAFAAAYIRALKGEQSAETAQSILLHIANSVDSIRYPDRKEDIYRFASVVGSHPWWLAKRWIDRFGEEEGMRLLVADNNAFPLALRINRLNVEVKTFLDLLQSRGIKFSSVPWNDSVIMLDTPPSFAHLNTYKKGLFTQYSLSGALAIALLDPQQDESILCFNGGAAGKALHIAEAMLNTGKVMSIDRLDVKSAELQKEIVRLGIVNLSAHTADPATAEMKIADRVVVDAAGSQLGMSSRNPATRWKLVGEHLKQYGANHLALLTHAAQFVKPGGVLLYATQSTEPDENEHVIRMFLESTPRFMIDQPGRHVPREFVTKEGYVQSLPHRHSMEGSFAVRMVRGRA